MSSPLRSLIGAVKEYLPPRADLPHSSVFCMPSRSMGLPAAVVVLEELVSPQYRVDSDAQRPPRRISSDKDAEVLEWWLKRSSSPPTAVVRITRFDGGRLSTGGLSRLRGCIATIDAVDAISLYREVDKDRVHLTLTALGNLGRDVRNFCLRWDPRFLPTECSTYHVEGDLSRMALSQLHGLEIIRGGAGFTMRSLADALGGAGDNMPYLRELNVTRLAVEEPTAAKSFGQSLSQLPIESFAVTLSPMADDVFSPLAVALSSFGKTLTSLNLSYCNLQPSSVQMLSSALEECSGLQVLVINGNAVVTAGTLQQGSAFAASLMKLSRLQHFVFSTFDPDDMVLDALAPVIRHWVGIESINCFTPLCGDLQRFAESVALSTLQRLTIQIPSESRFSSLVPVVRHLPQSLSELELSTTDMSTCQVEEILVLAPYLERCRSNLETFMVTAAFDEETVEPLWRRLHAVIPQVGLGDFYFYD